MSDVSQSFLDWRAECDRDDAAASSGDPGVGERIGETLDEAASRVEDIPGLAEELTNSHHVRTIMGDGYPVPDR